MARRTNRIYRSLNEERTYGGVQKEVVLANAGFTALAIAGLNWWWVLLPAIGLHVVMRNINKNDPKIMQVYARYSRQATRYDPWPHRVSDPRRDRPTGFSRGMSC